MPTKRVSEIKTREPFEGLFPIDNKTLAAVTDDMREQGYDAAQPIILWKEGGCILDGHTRLLAAQAAGIEDVPVAWKSFASEDEAVAYSIHCQRDRRNLTGADILRWVGELDKRQTAGRKPKELASLDANFGKSADRTAETIGTSTRKVEKARAILDYAPPEVKAQVLSGEKSINKAYTETQAKRKEEKKSTKASAKPRRTRGSLENWKQFREIGERVLQELDAMKVAWPDADHIIPARDICGKIARKATQLMESIVKGD